jgi:predicted transcriptional regulator
MTSDAKDAAPSDEKDTAFIGVLVDKDVVRQLDEIATNQACTRSWLVRRALKNFVLRPDVQAPLAQRNAAE